MMWLHDLSHWVMRPGNLGVICMAQISCLIAIYGGVISAAIRKQLKPHGFPVRVLGFILMHAFVFGALSAILAGLLAILYRAFMPPWPPVVMLGVFLAVGLLAEEHKKI